MSETAPLEASPSSAQKPIVGAVVTIAFAVLTALVVAHGISDLLHLLDSAGVSSGTPWVALVAPIALPAVAFATALVVGRRMRTGARVIVFTMALTASAALSFSFAM